MNLHSTQEQRREISKNENKT